MGKAYYEDVKIFAVEFGNGKLATCRDSRFLVWVRPRKSRQREPHEDRIFNRINIIARPTAGFGKAQRLIQLERRQV
jgi:hypothetical protein